LKYSTSKTSDIQMPILRFPDSGDPDPQPEIF